MYKALFKIQSPSAIHYERILKDDILHLPGFCKIGINSLSNTFLIAYDADVFETSFLLRLFESKGIFCSLEWVVEDSLYRKIKTALVKLRSVGCRLFFLFGISLAQTFFLKFQRISFGLACLGLGDLYWTMHQIRASGCLPNLIQSQMRWLSIHTFLCFFLKLNGDTVFPPLLLFHFLLAVFNASVLLHTDLISKLTHQQDIDHLWENIKAIRNGIHDLIEIPVDSLIGGEFILVQVGDIFPVDGIITSGATLVNDSWLDGKTHSCPKYEGDQVLSGSRNLTASVIILASCSRKLSLFSRIHDNLVPQYKKKNTIEFRFSILPFLICMLCIHFLEQILTGVFHFSQPSFILTLQKINSSFPFLGFLGLALTDALTRRQILEKFPEIYVPKLSLFSKPIQQVIFKKEFLTRKRYVLKDILTLPSAISIELTFHSSFSKGAVLLIASSIQRHINLELAQALFDIYIPNSTQKKPKEAIEIVSSMLSFSKIDPGKGIETCFRGSNILMGLPDWVSQKGKVDLSMIRDWIDTCLIKGEHVEVMSLEGAIIAAFSFSEQCLPNASSILESIQRANCQPILYTERVREPFVEEIRELTDLKVICPDELSEILKKADRKVACIEHPWTAEQCTDHSHIEICTLKERTGDSIPIQVIPQKEEHIGLALILINDYVYTRNFNILLSYLWTALTLNLQVFISSHWMEIALILFQFYGALMIGFHATECSRSSKK